MFRFKLNGVELYDEPIGWQEFSEAIVRDEDLHGFTVLYENDLTFVGDGYNILNTIFLESYCAEVILQVDYQCDNAGFEPFVELLIKITDLDQNLERCTAQAKATDNGYYGMVHSNRAVPVRLSAEYSKNGVAITPCPSFDMIMIQPVQDGIGYRPDEYPDTRQCYDHLEALAFVLRFVTDNRITSVQSDYLEALVWDNEIGNPAPFGAMSFAFVSGLELREHSGQPPTVTFEGIVSTLYALHNVFWKIEGTVLRLEPYTYFFQPNEIKLPLLRDLIRSTDVNKLYATVQFGSAKSEDERSVSATYPTPVNWSMPFVDIIAHGKQEYPLGGICQTDVVLNLISEYIYDSNLIEKVLYEAENLPSTERPDQAYDNDVFYIQYVPVLIDPIEYLSCYSYMFVLPTTPIRGWTFNPYLWHSEVIGRHQVQSDLVLYEADSDDNFKATAENPDNWVGDFQTTTIYLDTALFSGSALAQMATFFSRPSWPEMFYWGGILNNAFTDCLQPESGCTDPPVNLQFNNDSTGGNFDPNDNWSTTDYWFTSPATGVYGFKIQLFINKLRDVISFAADPDEYFPIDVYGGPGFESGDPNERIIFHRFVDIVVYFTVFDSSNNVVSSSVAPYNGNEVEVWEINDGSLASSIVTNIFSSGNSQIGIEAVQQSNYTIAQLTPQQWANQYVVNRDHLMYIENGQHVRMRLSLRPKSHIRPLNTVARRVDYGVLPNSTIETFYIRSGGGEFAPVNPLLHQSLKYDFNRPLDYETWKQIRENPSLGFQIGVGETNLTNTHVSRIARTLATGETTFEMMANRNQQFI